MKTISDKAAGLAAALRREDGVGLPVAIAVMSILLVVAGVAFSASVNSQTGSNKDREVKRALAAADAGLSLATYRMNKIDNTITAPCVVDVNGSFQAVAADSDGWCPEVSEGSFSYRVKLIQEPTQENDLIVKRIVVTGTSGGQTRRVMGQVATKSGSFVFGLKGVQSLEKLTITGNAEVESSVGSNENVEVGGSARLCGDAVPGPGHQLVLSGGTFCQGFSSQPASEPLVLSPVAQGDVTTNNDNDRLFGLDVETGDPSWDPTARTLELNANDTVTFGGGDYSFCSITLNGRGQIIIASGAKVRFFFDTPEACGLSAGATQLQVNGSGIIDSTDNDPGSAQFFFAGSSSIETKIQLNGNSSTDQHLAIYAPLSTIEVSGNTNVLGAMAAKKVELSGTSQFTYDERVNNISASLILLYGRQRYVECTPTAAGEPDAGC